MFGISTFTYIGAYGTLFVGVLLLCALVVFLVGKVIHLFTKNEAPTPTEAEQEVAYLEFLAAISPSASSSDKI